MDITLLRTFLTNIGNGFIDKGARVTLESVFPNSNITETSGFPLYARHASAESTFHSLGQKIGVIDESKKDIKNNDFQHLYEYINTDLVVFPGCVLYPDLLSYFQPVLNDAVKKNVPILFLGVGGYEYRQNKEETNRTRSYLQNLSQIGMISRDQPCYKAYADLFDFASQGIDNAFFIDEWYQPPSSTTDFEVHTFDKQREPDIDTKQEVLKADHNPFGYSMPFSSMDSQFRNRLSIMNRKEEYGENVLVSDLLEDYLFLYSNSNITHSDRIHACVPSLAYGNKAKFYYKTQRSELFNQVLNEDISSRPVSLPREKIRKKKAAQKQKVESAISEIMKK